jgi:hypothetical protein
MKENEKIQDEEEISFLDLFTVLLRYRKLIIGITLAFIILAVAGYLLYPVYQYNKAIKTSLAQGRIIISIKQGMLNYITKSPEYFINRADVVMDSLRDAGMDRFEYKKDKSISLTDEAERTKALYFINQLLILNKNLNGKDKKEDDRIFQIITSTTKIPGTTRNVETVVKDGNSIEVFYKDTNPELIKAFFQNLIIYGNEIAKEYIQSLAEAVVKNYEQIMNGNHTGLSWENAMGGNLFYYAFIKDYLDGKETIMTALGEPVITKPEIFLNTFRSSFKQKCVIFVFAGFFISIVLAFVLNAIRKIRDNEETMKKIREAMGNSDGK